ncbi:ClpP family protease [Clostridium pasteurianum]|uniref:Protease subunit of ATP-dependent protease n=1 Tax=Clostridium pasteurianum BC1 TaxID=86416 RepID=R4K4D8_CLOPA|nr:ATP-dependent Clp protease proteolytic subunit [Clostridium pasteurianum]AGK97458.1 protease subunit of ATP-dependent protease [Clostridium pasteurianum BC1]
MGKTKDKKNEKKENNEQLENVKELGVDDLPEEDERIYVLPIIGQVEGHTVLSPQTKTTKYEHVIPQLVSIERSKSIEGVLIVLNTVGGDVEAGLAIAEMIRSLSKPTVSLVIGGGHSIGVPLATAADYSFISPSATMIIHPIRMNGLIIGVPQTFEYFNKMQQRIIEFIARTSKIDKDTIKKLMIQSDELLNDMGTILIGNQAVDYGLIDDIGGIKEALEKLEQMIQKQQP